MNINKMSDLIEASWCNTCAKRKTCSNKNEVATEEHLITFAPAKFLNVNIVCNKYIKDPSLPKMSDKEFSTLFFKVR